MNEYNGISIDAATPKIKHADMIYAPIAIVVGKVNHHPISIT
jgi:hypothetical protein